MDAPHHVAAHLARNLTSLRHARTLTQDALAKAAGVPRSTIANLESGDGNPSLAVLVKVANSLGVPIDELLASPRAKVRKWEVADVPKQTQGRGITLRPLVPEPVPEEMLTVMDFAPSVTSIIRDPRTGLAFPGNVPHSYQNPDAATGAHGVSVVILAKAGV